MESIVIALFLLFTLVSLSKLKAAEIDFLISQEVSYRGNLGGERCLN